MRRRTLWLVAAFMGTLSLVGVSFAAPPGGTKAAGAGGQCAKEGAFQVSDGARGTKPVDAQDGRGGRGEGARGNFVQDKGGFQGKGKGKGGKGGGQNDVTLDRILSFDKNNDGKVTKDELPERLQDLIGRHDTNKDGALDRDEIQRLVAQGPGGFGGPKGGFGGPGGPKGKGGPFAKGPAAVERVVADLNLSDKTREKADALVKAHQESVRKLMDLARSDLLLKMKDVLNEQEFNNFKTALDRQPQPPFAPKGAAAPNSNAAELERRLDRLVRELEELRRDIRR